MFWVGIPFASAVFGDVFAPFNPWRALARGVAWVAGARGRAGAARSRWPTRRGSGRWPAVAGILAFAWVELVYDNRDDPSLLATLALLYAAMQLVGMSVYGIEPWSAPRRRVRASTSACSRGSRRCTGATGPSAARHPLGGARRSTRCRARSRCCAP